MSGSMANTEQNNILCDSKKILLPPPSKCLYFLWVGPLATATLVWLSIHNFGEKVKTCRQAYFIHKKTISGGGLKYS